jgi:hypothetical protein
MDFLKLDERIMELVDGEKFDAAEAELHQAKLQASNAADHQALDHVLSLLVTLSRIKVPPDLAKAEAYCLEIEKPGCQSGPIRYLQGRSCHRSVSNAT